MNLLKNRNHIGNRINIGLEYILEIVEDNEKELTFIIEQCQEEEKK